MPEPNGDLPGEVPTIRAFVDELRSLLSERAGDSLVVAGVDFCHVGPRFGGDALKLVNSDDGRANNYRGINAKVVVAGTIRTGDSVVKKP